MRVSEIARNSLIGDELPALGAACDGIAARRAATATLAENLTERRGHSESRFLALIRDAGSNNAVHPSDVAVALTALDALVEISAADGTRVVSMEGFHQAAFGEGNAIASVAAVVIPKEARRGMQHYHEYPGPDGSGITAVSIAGCKRENGDVRIVLGGVGTRPWRVNSSIEEDISSGGLDEDIIETLAERALYDAEPISENAYKVDLAAQLIRQIIGELA